MGVGVSEWVWVGEWVRVGVGVSECGCNKHTY